MGIISQKRECVSASKRNVLYINYETFAKLLDESKEYDDFEMYVAERGWQEWMNPFEQSPELISKILSIVFRMGKEKIKEARELAGISSRAEMSRKYRIPLRTLENWELSENNMSNYTLNLILYTFFLETLNVEEAKND